MSSELERYVAALLLVGVRLGTLLTFAPFFGSTAVSPRIKAAFFLALTALLGPVYAARLPAAEGTALNWTRILMGEVIVGLLLALALHFVFDGVQLAGHLVGFQLGFSLVNLIDPQTEIETTVFSLFHQVLTLLIFLHLDVHHWLLRAVAASFRYLPPGTVTAGAPAAELLLQTAGSMWLVAIQFAAPVLLATMLADVALGFLGKASPQMPVLFVGLSVKALLGFSVLAGVMMLWPAALAPRFEQAIQAGEQMLRLAR